MSNLIEEAKAYAQGNIVGCHACSKYADPDCIGASARADFLKGVEWALHKIAGEGRCTYFFGPGEELCALAPEMHSASTSAFLPEFRHEFQP